MAVESERVTEKWKVLMSEKSMMKKGYRRALPVTTTKALEIFCTQPNLAKKND